MSRIEHWETKRLDELGEIVTGNTPSKKCPEYYGGDIPWAKPSDLDNFKSITETEEYLTKEGADQARILPKDSILVSCIGNLGKVGIAGTSLATNQQINAIIFNDSVYPKFGYYTCRRLQKLLEHLAPATTLPIISKSKFSELKISIPPLPIQRKIASILEKAESAKEKRKEANRLTNEFLKSAFLEMFGDPIKNPKGYKKIRLRELCEVITKGTTPTTYGHIFTEDGVRFLKIENIDDNGKILLDSVQYISKDTHKFLKRSQLLEGDMLFSIAGALGRTAIVTKECLPANINQALALIRLKPSYLAIEYLSYYLRAGFIIEQIRKNKRGVAQMNLNLQQVGDFDILLPPYELQQKFADLVQKVEKLKEKQQESEKELDNLFNSLMQKAFKEN